MVPDIRVTLWQCLAPLLLGAALSWLVTSRALLWGSHTEAGKPHSLSTTSSGRRGVQDEPQLGLPPYTESPSAGEQSHCAH